MVDTPGNPFKPAASNNSSYYSSGLAVIPTSGTPTASGPWMEEHQDLTIDYVRVPYAEVSATTLNLSTGNISHGITGTRLALHVTAHYRKEKTYIGHSDPDPSGFQQTQRFQVNAVSADHMGNTYGDLSAGASGTAMGPAGTIITSQPWYYRRKWDAAVDTEVNKQCDGWQFFVGRYTTTGINFSNGDMPSFFHDFEGGALYNAVAGSFKDSQLFLNPGELRMHPIGAYYSLDGPYTTTQETTIAIFNLIDTMGQNVSISEFMSDPPNGTGSIPNFDQGFAEYSIARHDYTA